MREGVSTAKFNMVSVLLPPAMPVDQNAASRYESGASAAASDYEANATTEAWREGVSQGDIEGGLEEAGVANVRGSGLQNKWEDGVNEAEFRVDRQAYEAGIDGDSWLEAMSDASNWNI